jgi:hypothetical protein
MLLEKEILRERAMGKKDSLEELKLGWAVLV